MNDWPQLAAGGALTLLVLREVFAFLNKRRTTTNGHGPTKASVRPEDAPEFYLMQKRTLEIVERIEQELNDPMVKRHHRELR